MKHFIAYGNSDQESFRSEDVLRALDYLTVPGTIASYYPDATAAFVLSSRIDYVIDPRTPLFQGKVDPPKASHFSLADWHGPTVRQYMGSDVDRLPVQFSAALYTSATVTEMVDCVIRRQREYGGRAETMAASILDRYRKLSAKVEGRPEGEAPGESKSPSFLLAPYFVRVDEDWKTVNKAILAVASAREDSRSISPVLAVNSPAGLLDAFSDLSPRLSQTVFFWIDGFKERSESKELLSELWGVVSGCPSTVSLINLYGGFFSICLAFAGLWGFNNGLGYSESRDWPQLPATGAAPPRYYISRLHAFLPPGAAQLVVTTQPSFACSCPVCAEQLPASLTYHGLKKHFAFARRAEIDFVSASTRDQVATDLVVTADEFDDQVARRLPRGVPHVGTDHLRRWASVLGGA